MKLSELNFNRYLYKDLGATDEIDSSLLASNLFDENKNKLSSGDTAYDLNSSSLLLNGGVIAPSTITAAQIDTIESNQITGPIQSSQIENIAADKIDGQITSNQIENIAVDKIDGQILSSQIDKIAVDKIDGQIIATQISSIDATTITIGLIENSQIDSVSASKLTAGTIDADVISVINLDASNITSGSLKVGGTSEPSYIELANSTSGTSGKLRWEQGSKIWEDKYGDMGINAIGGQLIIYCDDDQVALFQNSGKTIFYGDTSFQSTVYLSSGNNTFIWGNDRTNVHIGTSSSGTLIYKRGGVTKAEFGNNLTLQGYLYQPNVNYIELDGYRLTLTANKTAIVPTSRGFNALYCMESPEVWFMDFVKRKNRLDPMFEEVTVPPYHYIKCSGGGYQVWGKRKGHENKRFETKSEAEFLANERFLSMNKVKK